MSNKLKPNFTAVPNVVFDSIMGTLTPGALKVLLAICRFTYGWGKQSDRISLGQLAEMTNMNRSNVHRAVKQLGQLVIVKAGDPRISQASEYRLNIEISDADLLSPEQQPLLSQRQSPVVRPVVTSATIQRKPKKEDNSARTKRARSTDTDPRIKTLLAAFIEKYRTRAGKPYVVIAGKDPALLKRLLSAGHDIATIEGALDRYFADDFYSKTGFDVGGFAKAFNRINSAGARVRRNYDDGAIAQL